MMTFACPSCAAQLQIPPNFAGKMVACPKCKTTIRLESPATAPPPEAAATTAVATQAKSSPKPSVQSPPRSPSKPALKSASVKPSTATADEFAFTPNSPSAPPTPSKPRPKSVPEPEPETISGFDFGNDTPESEPVSVKSKKRRPEPEPEEDEDEDDAPKRVDKKKPKSKSRSKEPADSNRLLWLCIAGGGGLAAFLLIGGVIAWSLGSAGPAKVAVAKAAPPKKGQVERVVDKGGNRVADPSPKVEPDVPIQPMIVPAGPDIGQATGELPAAFAPETVKKVKKATAFIKVVMTDDLKASGSGWFGLKGGTVVTNAHVVDMLQPYSKEPKKIEVVINSGLPDEKTFLGQVIGVDRENDLALLSVNGQAKDWPEPLLLSASDSLTELQNVYIFGFPLGLSLGSEISVNPSTISAFRRNEVGSLRYVQVAGGMHPGNSGGPVVDTRGAVVGVSVSVLRGTMINFAVPGDKVRQLVNGRVLDTRIYEPFKEGNAVRLPVEIETLDPMRRIKEVNIEIWAGPPGKVRPGGATPPQKKDGDGPRTIVEARLETQTAVADVDMPQVAKDKVIWVQPVLTDTRGQKLWGNAEPLVPSGLPPLDRPNVTIVPQLDRPAERTVRVKEAMSFREMSGISERESMSATADVKVLEKVSRTANGGAKVSWSVGDSTQEVTEEGKTTKGPSAAAELARSIPLDFLLDAQGRIATTKVGRPSAGLDKKVQRGAVAIMNAMSNAFQLTALYPPNPNDECRPNVSWYGQTQVYLGVENRLEPVVFASTWTYEGLRMHEGHRWAYCRFAGYFRSPNPRQASVFNNQVEGHVHFDLEDGFVAESKVKIVSEITDGQRKYGNIALDIEVTRTPGNLYSIVPPKVVADGGSGKLKKLTSQTARLEPNDPKLPMDLMDKIEIPPAQKLSPFPFKAYSLKLEKGKTYVIDMIRTEKSEFDPYLVLLDKTMKVVDQDDDGGGEQNARITFTCNETETYRLIATCLSPTIGSAYRIDVSTSDGAGSATLEPEP
jgi:S1-C subfamily serine protease